MFPEIDMSEDQGAKFCRQIVDMLKNKDSLPFNTTVSFLLQLCSDAYKEGYEAGYEQGADDHAY